MPQKNQGGKIEKLKEHLTQDYRKKLDEIFSQETFDLSFDEREKLIDQKIDKQRNHVLQTHLEKDPDGIVEDNNLPEQTKLCVCGCCTILCKDENGNPKIFIRQLKTKRGLLTVKEYGYYCSKCRKVFFPSEKEA